MAESSPSESYKEAVGHGYTPTELHKLLVKCITQRTSLKNIKLVIRAGADPNATVVKGLRPIHYSVYDNNLDALKLLIQYGVEVNQSDDNGYTPLHHAAKKGHLEAAQLLLENGAIVNFLEATELTAASAKSLAELSINPLNLAIENDFPKVVELLLQHGADPNAKYFLGSEINMVPPQHTECLALLLRFGADPNVVHRGGLTVLMRCCKLQCVGAVRTLIEHGADVNQRCPPPFDQRQALHFAALSGNLEICRLLLDAGAKTNRCEDYEYCPLEFAITQEKLDVCRLLLDYGADPNEINADGCSPLQIACMSARSDVKIIECLLEAGANPRFVSRHFSTGMACLNPLVEYFSYHDEIDGSIVRLFLEYGASVNMTIPTRLFRIVDGAGLLQQVRKLRPYEDVLALLIEASKTFDVKVIETTSSLSNRQKELLLEAARYPRSLKQLCRLEIRQNIIPPLRPKLHLLNLPALVREYLLFATKLECVY